MLPIWSLGNGRLIVSMDISMHLPPHNLPLALSLCLSLSLALPLPAVAATSAATPPPPCMPPPTCAKLHVFFCRKTFSLLPFKTDTFAHFAHRAAASATATARPHASCLSLPPLPVPWPEQLAFVHGLASTPERTWPENGARELTC